MTARLVCTSLIVFCAIAACSDDSVDSSTSSGGTSGSGGGIATTGGSSGTGPSTGGSATSGGSSGSTSTGGSSTGATGGTTSSGGSSSGGTTSSGGSSSSSGGTTSAGGSGGGTAGGQPLGALCANDSNCSQAQGAAVCCQSECTLAANCPAGTPYLPCNVTGDCAAYGGGKICCEWGSGGTLMRFCTKQSGCAGKILP